MPEPRPDLAAIRERLRHFIGASDYTVEERAEALVDVGVLVARCRELEAALREIAKWQYTGAASDYEMIRIARAALAAAQEEPR